MSETDAAAEIARRGLRLWTDSGFVLIGQAGKPFAARGSTKAEALARLIANERKAAAPPAPVPQAAPPRPKADDSRKGPATLFDNEV